MLNEKKSPFFYVALVAITLIFALGTWWAYLVTLLFNNNFLNNSKESFLRMITWEGLTFFISISVLIVVLLYLYYQDSLKTKALQTFFASLNHELKTPIASIKLQANILEENLQDKLQENKADTEFLNTNLKYLNRISNDLDTLENDIVRSLEIAKIDKPISNNFEIELASFIQELENKYNDKIHLDILIKDKEKQITKTLLIGDSYYLNIVFKNLIENTIKHSKQKESKAFLELEVLNNINMIKFTYYDHGERFKGEINKLGKLFYKFNSNHGQGIGIYLIKSLLQKMGSKLEIINKEHLTFTFNLKSKLKND